MIMIMIKNYDYFCSVNIISIYNHELYMCIYFARKYPNVPIFVLYGI